MNSYGSGHGYMDNVGGGDYYGRGGRDYGGGLMPRAPPYGGGYDSNSEYNTKGKGKEKASV